MSDVIGRGAPLYTSFLNRLGVPRPDLMPLPQEFSVAAFRFGHSMVRASYNWSRFFGRAVDGGPQPFLDRAGFDLLFQFTGGAENPMPLPNGDNAPRLRNIGASSGSASPARSTPPSPIAARGASTRDSPCRSATW